MMKYTTDPPVQNVVGPPALIVGVTGAGLTVTVVALLASLEQPEVVTITVYEPEAVAL